MIYAIRSKILPAIDHDVSVTRSGWFCGHLEYSITGKVHKILIKIPLCIIVSTCIMAKLRSSQPYRGFKS